MRELVSVTLDVPVEKALECLLTLVDRTNTALVLCAISAARIKAKPPPPAIAMRMVMIFPVTKTFLIHVCAD